MHIYIYMYVYCSLKTLLPILLFFFNYALELGGERETVIKQSSRLILLLLSLYFFLKIFEKKHLFNQSLLTYHLIENLLSKKANDSSSRSNLDSIDIQNDESIINCSPFLCSFFFFCYYFMTTL